MTAEAAVTFPGMEAGRRVERTEWGLRTTRDTFLHRKGHVTIVQDEAFARAQAHDDGSGYNGWWFTEVVSRTVVTYTTNWEKR